jgi:3-hydroxyisobutyrate dehydrogenase-like beta-hydroxyacid dehydrogenase
VDTSTSEPSVTARLRAACAARGVTLVDAPLARSPVEAEQGRLNTMVGAEPADFARLLPLIKGVWAENVVHVGGPGAGHTVKLLNNMLAMNQCVATAEAFAVGVKAGIDPRKLVEVVSLGGVNSGMFQNVSQALVGDLERGKFELDNARKDIRYYTHMAESVSVPCPHGDAVLSGLALASALGHGKKFVNALVLAQEQINGIKIVGEKA